MATEKIKKVAMRTATLNKEIDVENRKVQLCFMTEKACDNWWIPEVCLCNRENADLTRFENGIAPVLFNHDRDKIIGKIEEITFDNKRANATIVFDSDEESEAIFKKVQSGSLRGVSVGYIRQATTRIEANSTNPIEFMGSVYKERTDVTTKWELLEISIVSVPADNDTGVGRDLGDIEINVLTLEKENEKELNKMAKENENQPVNVEAERELAVKAERERTQQIFGLCRKFEIADDKANAFITDGKTVEQVRSAILDEIAERQKPAPVATGKDENEKVREAIISGLCLRNNVKEEKIADGANNYRAMTLRSVAEDVLEREGVSGVRYMDGTRLFERAMGSGAFLGIMDEYVHKVMRNSAKEQAFIWKNFVSTGTNTDFKPNYKYEMGLDGLPVLMPPESGEFKAQEMSDAKISTTVATYGKAIKFTREIFINDQLGQVTKAIAMQTGGFERLKEQMFFATLKKVQFNAKNKNLVTAKGITEEVYDEMARLMMEQKDINDEGFVGVPPKYIIAPTNQRMAHRRLLNSTAQVGQANPGVINTVQGDYELFVTPYLTGDDFYAIASPAMLEGIEFTTLAGSNGVQSRIVVSQAYLGQEIQLWEDFAFNIIDPAAFVKASAK